MLLQFIKRGINYRPISLTVHICEVFASIVRDRMLEHLEKYALVKESQHGFVKDKYCLTNLLIFMEEVTSYIDSGFPVDVIYLDFSVANKRYRIAICDAILTSCDATYISCRTKNKNCDTIFVNCFV